MPIAFSFFSSKRAQATDTQPLEATGVEEAAGTEIQASAEPISLPPAKKPFPTKDELRPPPLPDSLPTLILPTSTAEPRAGILLPEKREAKGLAALAVNQSGTEAPPLNRRAIPPPFPLNSLLGAPLQTPHETESWHGSPPTVSQLSNETLRQELQNEIEQVKSDLFGAAMGVSALKDRIDGVEALAATKQSVTGPTQDEVHAWISAWLDANLPQALERALFKMQEQALSTLSSPAFFRQPAPFQSQDRHSLLSQPPVILTSTPL